MPLYQMVIIARCSTPEHLASATCNIAKGIWQSGGVVRNINILSDRILPRRLQGNDKKYAILGRFTQILFDGSPNVMNRARLQSQKEKTILKVEFFNIKDFYSHAQEYHKSIGSQMQNDSKKADVARKIAILREEGVLNPK